MPVPDETGFTAGELSDAVAAGRGRRTELSPSFRDWIRPPDLMVGAVHPELMRVYFEQTIVLGTTLFTLPDAEVVAEGVIFLDGAAQYCNQLNTFAVSQEAGYRAQAARRATLRRVEIAEPVVLLAGTGHQMYGHWLVDFLPKFFLLDRAGHDITRLRYLLPTDTPDFARVWLGLLGIGADRIFAYDRERDRLACRELLVPTTLRFAGRASPLMREARRFLMRRVFPPPRWRLGRRRPPAGTRRLLISRSDNADTRNRRTLRERAELEARALARGYEIVRPERLSVPEQIALFRSAETIVGEYGSGLHGSLFAPSGATVVSLRDNGLELGFLQSSIDHTLGHASGYVFGTARDAQGFFSVPPPDIDLAFDWIDARGLR
ncbi:capsular biosynthesis protein [Methylobacterium sp. Leaf456]|uniref:glycosyltransferase family 61 protein n=1 Tax=Methylobacterium sp. Leaf456 TaxID=1736382 RepID=UPI0006FD0182|nr:glycosyltransferase family 61 protein [Methylobacterium sp. Leaf456]KQT58594.1 capsular biosynthesis protein [Methylobacterium sp. Leaf456]